MPANLHRFFLPAVLYQVSGLLGQNIEEPKIRFGGLICRSSESAMKSQVAMSAATTLLLSRSAIPHVLFESARTHSQNVAAWGLNPRKDRSLNSPPLPRSG